MDMNTYQASAMSFRLPSANETYAVFGLLEEAGEVAGKYAKATRDGAKDTFEDDVAKELGDVLWMVAAIAEDLDIDLNDIATMNIEKLASRKLRDVIKGSGDER